MAQAIQQRHPERIKSATGVAALHAAMGYALLSGFGYGPVSEGPKQLKIFHVTPELPPPPVEQPPPAGPRTERMRTPEPEGAASPPNLRSTPTPVVAPRPVVPLPARSPLAASPVAGEGARASAGAAQVPGPGTGSGGEGSGTGSGASGIGTGGGGGGIQAGGAGADAGAGRGTPARFLKGRIRESDYPRSAIDAGAGGTVRLRWIITPTGRVSDCTVTRSSGRADLDATTCRIITERFRYRPAKDENGRAISQVATGEHVWVYEERAAVPVDD